MFLSRNIVASGAAALLALAAYGVYRTNAHRTGSHRIVTSATDTVQALDDRTLATVLELIALPTTAEEVPFAQDALRFADQDADLAFASSIRQELTRPQTMTPEAQAIADRLDRVLQRAVADSALAAQLASASRKPDTGSKNAGSQLEIAKARLEIDRDQIDNARDELAHAGGDVQSRIRAIVQEHEETSQHIDSIHIKPTATLDDDGLVEIGRAYSTLRLKDIELQQAAAVATAAADSLRTHRRTPEQRAADNARVDSALGNVSVQGRTPPPPASGSAAGRRSDNQKRLAGAYKGWLGVVQAHERALMNRALQGLVLIFSIVLLWIFSDTLTSRVLVTSRLDRRSLQRLRVVTRVSLQAIGILLVIIVIFGTPNNLGTILGLAGAGLTVALKDFIVSFVGWLVLMGRNGVRIGDLVEINGVTGEVIELGLFNTVLHETGNWTDAGHPTGRRVTFTNSYAIEGHYFNFSTSGQWLWDEVRIAVPAGKDPSRVVESLQTVAQEVTADSARLAEKEWKGVATTPGHGVVTAAPTISIKPIMGGVEVALRYITHAADRSAVRAKLYQTAVAVLGEPQA